MLLDDEKLFFALGINKAFNVLHNWKFANLLKFSIFNIFLQVTKIQDSD